MVLAPIVALGGALRWSRWPRFALGIGTVAFFVVLTEAEPSAADVEILQKLMAVGTSRGRLDFLGGYAPLRVPKRSPPAHRKLGSRLRFYMGGSACLPSRTGGAPIHGWM
jgi:hypothetical protein